MSLDIRVKKREIEIRQQYRIIRMANGIDERHLFHHAYSHMKKHAMLVFPQRRGDARNMARKCMHSKHSQSNQPRVINSRAEVKAMKRGKKVQAHMLIHF